MKITLSSNFRIVENPQQNRDVFDLNSTSINDKSGQEGKPDTGCPRQNRGTDTTQDSQIGNESDNPAICSRVMAILPALST